MLMFVIFKKSLSYCFMRSVLGRKGYEGKGPMGANRAGEASMDAEELYSGEYLSMPACIDIDVGTILM